MKIEDIFAPQRIESTLGAVLVFVYLPFGSLLLLFRIFLTLNYLCSQLVFNSICSHSNIIRRSLERSILAVLGVFVVKRKSEIQDSKSITVANHVSRCDHIILPALCNSTSVDNCSFSSGLKNLLRVEPLTSHKAEVVKTIKSIQENHSSVFCFPQLLPTNNQALIKFSEWPFAMELPVQPVAVRAKRFLPIAHSTIDSTWWQDILWTYFSIVTIYDVTYLPTVAMQTDEDTSSFTDRVRKIIADELDVPCTNYGISDVREYLKRMRFEARKPQLHMSDSRDGRTAHMAKQVKDILPHVPLSVIINDVEKTQSVDVTVTNLLEGVVKFVPEQPSSPSTSSTSPSNQGKPNVVHNQRSFSRNPNLRHMSLQERKDAFVKQARDAYLKKHGFL
uniref:Lipid droplet-regulating VLDL assembly factor AUP1 n=1 Tax=Phallusia mammillata TaxID=59560 RepID=A0A6F9D740_9ASCI|nr:ancient ubiquitous protein 1-like [Phallusia mammillata]